MQQNQTNKVFYYLFSLSNILFVVLYVIISYHNRPSGDDFYAVYLLNKAGVLGGTQEFYNTWSGRWSSTAFMLFATQLLHLKHFLFFYHLGVLLLFTYSIKRLLNRLFTVHESNSTIAIYCVSALFYCSFNISESWFFFSATFIYLWSIIFLFLGISTLINSTKNKTDTILSILSFSYIGGASEPLAIIVLLGLTALMILKAFKNEIIKSVDKKNLSIALLFCLTTFVVSYAANGNRVREQFFPHISISDALLLNLKMTGIIVLKQLPLITPFVFVFSIPAYYWGVLNKHSNVNLHSAKKRILLLLILYPLILLLFQLPITYVTHDIGAARTLLPISLFTITTSSLLFYNLGVLIPLKLASARNLAFIAFFVICTIHVYNIVTQHPIVSIYSTHYDNRMNFIHENKNVEHPIVLKPLPNSGLVFSDDLSNDPKHYTNQHLQKAMKLKHTPVVP